jgi:RNA polymerase sigma-70 factor (ECF subfamily)
MADQTEKEFLDLMVIHQAIIIKICRAYHKYSVDQEDLSQEIIYNAWRSFSKFENRSKFSTWLYRVALNTAIYQNRKKKFLNKYVDLDLSRNIKIEEPNDQKEYLFKAINQLDPLEKSIIILYLDELSYKDISEITGLSESNIGVKLNRIRTKIKKILK